MGSLSQNIITGINWQRKNFKAILARHNQKICSARLVTKGLYRQSHAHVGLDRHLGPCTGRDLEGTLPPSKEMGYWLPDRLKAGHWKRPDEGHVSRNGEKPALNPIRTLGEAFTRL